MFTFDVFDEEALDAWMAKEFTGHGMAVRTKEEPAIPGEPLMSMATAKILTRRAVAHFVTKKCETVERVRVSHAR